MRKTEYREVIRDEIFTLIEAFDLNWREAALFFGVPKSTLHDLCNGLPPSVKTLRTLEANPNFSDAARDCIKALADWSAHVALGKPVKIASVANA